MKKFDELKIVDILNKMVKEYEKNEDELSVKFKEGTVEFHMESLTLDGLKKDVKKMGNMIAKYMSERIETSVDKGGIMFESSLKYKTKKWWKVSYDNKATGTYINISDMSPGK